MDIDPGDVLKSLLAGGTIFSLWGALRALAKKDAGGRITEGVELRLGEEVVNLAGRRVRVLSLTAVNRNPEPVTFRGYGLRLAGSRIPVHPGDPMEEVEFPVTLRPGGKVSVRFDRNRVESVLRGMGKRGRVKLAGFLVDGRGGERTSGTARIRTRQAYRRP